MNLKALLVLLQMKKYGRNVIIFVKIGDKRELSISVKI